VTLHPGTGATVTLNSGNSTTVNIDFPANAVNQAATITVAGMNQNALPVALSTIHNASQNIFVTAFTISSSDSNMTSFGAPILISGTVADSFAAGVTLNLAMLLNGVWVDIGTAVVAVDFSFQQNLVSAVLPGITAPGTYLVYEPAPGTSTAVSNLGIVLIADDGYGSVNGHPGSLQVIHIYDANGSLLSTPTISFLDYGDTHSDIDGQALTPDGSQGIMVDGGNDLLFFSQTQTGTPAAGTDTINAGSLGYGSDGDAVAILPNGDEAVVSLDSSALLVLSGLVSGIPTPTESIPLTISADGLVISNDGMVMLARYSGSLSVFAINAITPAAGSLGGTISHSFTDESDIAVISSSGEDGREGMAISPIDSSRAVIVGGSSAQMLTGLPLAAAAGTAITLTGVYSAYAVSITADGRYAVVGTDVGLVVLSGVDTGNLVQVDTVFAPTYTAASGTVTLGNVTTLGVTLDGNYLVVGDRTNQALVVIPLTGSTLGAPQSVLTGVAIPDNDQLLIH